MTIATELHGSMARFPSAPQLMSYIGVVPSEHSSSDRTRRGATVVAVARELAGFIWAALNENAAYSYANSRLWRLYSRL